jgi:hypothetical protein
MQLVGSLMVVELVIFVVFGELQGNYMSTCVPEIKLTASMQIVGELIKREFNSILTLGNFSWKESAVIDTISACMEMYQRELHSFAALKKEVRCRSNLYAYNFSSLQPDQKNVSACVGSIGGRSIFFVINLLMHTAWKFMLYNVQVTSSRQRRTAWQRRTSAWMQEFDLIAKCQKCLLYCERLESFPRDSLWHEMNVLLT